MNSECPRVHSSTPEAQPPQAELSDNTFHLAELSDNTLPLTEISDNDDAQMRSAQWSNY